MKRVPSLKKLTVLFFSFVLILSLSSCGSDNSDRSNDSNEPLSSDIVEIKDGIEIKWAEGDAKLTGYQLETTSEGDCINLYIDFTNPSKEEQEMKNNLYVVAFQNGIELDGKGIMTTEEEDNGFSEVMEGASIKCAEGFILQDGSDITIEFSADDVDDATMTLKLTEEESKSITGTPVVTKAEGEIAVKNGASLDWGEGKAVLTGYVYDEEEGTVSIYFDLTNTGKDDLQLANNLYVKPFKDGVEIDGSGYTALNEFTSIKTGVTIHCADEFELEKKGELIVKISAYGDDGEVESKCSINIK